MKSTYYVTYDNLAFRQELCPANIGKTVCDKVAMWAFWAVPGKNGFLWRVLNKSQIQSSNAYRWSPGYPILRWWAQANPIYDPKNMCQLFQDIFFIWALSMRYNHHQGSWFMKKAHKFSTPPSFDGLLTHLEIRVPSFCFLVFSNNKKNAQSHFHIYIFTVSLSHRNKTDFIKRGDIKGDFLTFRLHFVRQAAENNNSPYLSSEVELLK